MKKECKKCHIIKELKYFTKHNKCLNGVTNKCLSCDSIYKQEYLKNNPKYLESHRISDRKTHIKSRLLNKNKKKKEASDYRKSFPERIRAMNLLNNALRSGKLKRCKCRDCDKINTQGHHPDYSKPLNVIWLCPSHHKLEHLGRPLSESKQ